MPFLSSLASEGTPYKVESTCHISGPSVWPTFITGKPPLRHGVYSQWGWDPNTMSINRCLGEGLVPFWRPLVERGIRVGIMDVPYAPLLGVEEGFEVNEWGAHEVLNARMAASPTPIASLALDHPHPFGNDPPEVHDFSDVEGLKRVAKASHEGAARRGDLVEMAIRASDSRFRAH